MVRSLTAALLVGLLSVALVGAAPPDDRSPDDQPVPGSFTHHRYEADDPDLSRDYWLYVPRRPVRPHAPLVVYLHGCNQDAEDVAVGTRWNALAEARGWIVVYPDQHDPNTDEQPDRVNRGNGGRCWNWFRPDHQHRDVGEAATIAAITREVAERLPVDRRRTYLLGLSAGGIMASVMGAAYPDLYAAIGVVAGCGYPDCADPSGALAAAEMGERLRPLPVMVVHGTADTIAPFPLGEQAVQQWLGTADIADGDPVGSVPRRPAATEQHDPDGIEPAEGDPCVGGRRLPCLGGVAGFQGRYPATVEHYVDRDERSLVDLWIVHGLGHAYPGGDPRGSFTDPLGPDVTAGFADFFAAHPMSAPR